MINVTSDMYVCVYKKRGNRNFQAGQVAGNQLGICGIIGYFCVLEE